jgi:hypothetical protein
LVRLAVRASGWRTRIVARDRRQIDAAIDGMTIRARRMRRPWAKALFDNFSLTTILDR